jgi:excisionase family DNA binding protein
MNEIIVMSPEHLECLMEKVVRRALAEFNAQQVQTKKEETEVLSAKEATEYMKIPQATLYFYTCKRLIPFFKKGKRVYFNKMDLNEWIKSGKKEVRNYSNL